MSKINVLRNDTSLEKLYSKFSYFCLKRLHINSKTIRNIKQISLGDITISPFLFLKSQNILGALVFDDFDLIVFCEKPIIDILDCFKKDPNVTPSYDTRLIGFNNKQLMNDYIKNNMSDAELYEYCHQNNLKVKVLFTNIMVNEKMKMFGVEYIDENIREEHKQDIINFFNGRNG